MDKLRNDETFVMTHETEVDNKMKKKINNLKLKQGHTGNRQIEFSLTKMF